MQNGATFRPFSARRASPISGPASARRSIQLLPERGVVVASGGGTFADAGNRELMLRDGAVVWLDAPFATVVSRVPSDGRRPLATDRLAMEQLYNQRLAAYRLAHFRVDAGRGSVEELVDHIVEWLMERSS